MPNELTGDYDVAAEFSIPVINRLLAAMHRVERFPHSLTVRVDDNPPPGLPIDTPTLTGASDVYGDAVVDPGRIGPRLPPGVLSGTSGPFRDARDLVVNVDVADLNVAPIVPSHFQGRAQVQLSPPAIEITNASGNDVTVRLGMMCRYFPDPQTSPAPEFVRGELRISAPVDQAASQAVGAINVDIKANTASIGFTPHWSSSPLSAADRAGIDLLMRNALKTSFEPSNIPLPARIRYAKFKAFSSPLPAVALMVDLRDPGTSPPPDEDFPHGGLDFHLPPGVVEDIASATADLAPVDTVFLGSGDDFAFAVGSEFVRAAFQDIIAKIRATPIEPARFSVYAIVHTWHVTYNIELNDVTMELQNGVIVFTMKGYASTSSWTPNFSFTARQKFTLGVDGATAELVVGALEFDTSSIAVNVARWIVDLFTGAATGSIEAMRDSALTEANARQTVRDMLNAEENLGAFFESLLTPVNAPSQKRHELGYNSAEIRSSGIILHGYLYVAAWPPARVEYQQIPANDQGASGLHGIGGAIARGPDYSALRSWIPGGTIQRYEWVSQGQTGPGHIDENRFVLIREPFADLLAADAANFVTGYSPLCVRVTGTRLSASGPVQAHPVYSTVCGYSSFPIVSGIDDVSGGENPLVALTRRGPGGLVEVTGHTPARADVTGAGTPNLIVHFADAGSAEHLDAVTDALKESGRNDAATAMIAVMEADQLASTRYTPGVTYATSEDGAWERRFGIDKASRPMTVVVDPRGKVVWRHDGRLDSGTLAGALRKLLVAQKRIEPEMIPASARIGQPPPNFLFEHAPGHEITLRKLRGRPTTLVFWNSSSRPSIAAVRDLATVAGKRNRVVLAINDGEDAETARRVAKDSGLAATVVTDPHRRISQAYGVAIWPTIIELDAPGVVRSVRYGRDANGDARTQSGNDTVSQRSGPR